MTTQHRTGIPSSTSTPPRSRIPATRPVTQSTSTVKASSTRGSSTASASVSATTTDSSGKITSPRGPPSKPTASPSRTRTTSTRGGSTLAPPKSPAARARSPAKAPPRPPSPPKSPSAPALSLREAIALKRAEAKKAQAQSGSKLFDCEPLVGSIPGKAQLQIDEEVDLSRWSIKDSIERARSSGSLNLTARALASIPNALFEVHLGIKPEPLKIAPKEAEEKLLSGRTVERAQTAWFEAADLTLLKLRDNVIVEIQPEISLFGSLKILDLHNNQLTVIPDSFSELVNLVVLDLSMNQLTSLPVDIATLPLLSTLDVSSNRLTALPLNISTPSITSPTRTTSFFAPATIDRASKPLPSLRQLFAANNKLDAESIPVEDLPSDLTKVDIGNNALGSAKTLIHALSQLGRLKQLLMENTSVNDETFGSVTGFPSLELLDLGKTQVTESVGEIFENRPVSFDGEEIEGGVRVILGTRIQKEAWEIAAEKPRSRHQQPDTTIQSAPPKDNILQKESWEVEAEMGLLTEGGRRRARAAQAQADTTPPSTSNALSVSPSASTSPSVPSLTQYYDSALCTLTLPRSLPPAHSRARSLAPSAISDGSDPKVPAPTLPLPTIVSQPFARTLRCLILTNRRFDSSFLLPANITESEPLLPVLEELRLDACGLGDSVNITGVDFTTASRKEPIFNILPTLFPALTTLDLCDNKLTSLSGIRALLIPDPARKTRGLKVLRVRGNKITDLMGLEAVAQVLKSEGQVEAWRLEELDLRDNELAKLPPMLGYLPLDVLLVEGNTFRVPARRVWEREGTKGLLTWLKDRVE
ncbi:hypothetical protein BU17DRAFT_94151 [Hysterangium stoloniferum]|nr:hypothetical protein BU17DRAFT_94151 [Hysterangium stoloniferum]